MNGPPEDPDDKDIESLALKELFVDTLCPEEGREMRRLLEVPKIVGPVCDALLDVTERKVRELKIVFLSFSCRKAVRNVVFG